METAVSKLNKLAARTGQLSAPRSSFLVKSQNVYGARQVILGRKTIAAKVTRPGAQVPKSSVTVVGEAPEGFGKQVNWAPEDNMLALVIFLSAADLLGVMISGAQRGDTLKVISATGVASFAEGQKGNIVSGLIGIVGAGAKVTATIFGVPEIAPVNTEAEKFAKEQFKPQNVKHKCRDPFGIDPANGSMNCQEGGVVITTPIGFTAQIFTSGGSGNENRWVKKPCPRDYKHIPEHMKDKGAYFLESGSSNDFVAVAPGDFIIYPWDHAFNDNFGFYRLHVLLERKKPDPIIP